MCDKKTMRFRTDAEFCIRVGELFFFLSQEGRHLMQLYEETN